MSELSDLFKEKYHSSEFDETPRFQSEHRSSSDPRTFHAGDIKPLPHCGDQPAFPERMAIPYPRYPSPGAPLTAEIESAFQKEHSLWMIANRSLMYCIRFFETGSDYGSELAFLQGLWNGRNIVPTSREQLAEWHEDYKQFCGVKA
jgi:hypothetical protein